MRVLVSMSQPRERSEELSSSSSRFYTTHWSLVLTAQDKASPARAEAMELLCRTSRLTASSPVRKPRDQSPPRWKRLRRISRSSKSWHARARRHGGGLQGAAKIARPARGPQDPRPEREKDPQFAERFAREAQALAKLSHPHIVTVYDFGQADGLFYLLMEYVDGVNLRQLLRTRRLEPKEALAIVPPICDALQYAHDHAVVHRDIKPENLLLDKAGQVKIADFGIAKMLGGDSTPDEEQGVGTPHYMAPEQHATPQAADHRADIYSLGVVLYEMLTGELPAGHFELPSRKVRIDVRLDEIVLRALNREPELRFQKAGQMKTAVETLTGAGQEIGPDTPPSLSRANRSMFPNVRGDRAINVTMMRSRFRYCSWRQVWESPTSSAAVSEAILPTHGIRRRISMEPSSPIVIAIRLDPETGDMRFYKRQTTAPESLRRNPQNPRFVEEARRGLDALERADYDQAIVAFDELIRLDPNHSEAHRWRGDASLNKHELDKALSEYDEAIRLDPKNGMAYCGRGAASTGKREFDKAIASFDEAIRLDPEIANLSFYKRYRTAAESLRPNPRNRSLPKRPDAAQMRSREGITIKPSSPGTKRSALIRIIPRSMMAWRRLVE